MIKESAVTSSPDDHPNQAQVEYWNATAGEIWARFQDQLDRQIAPLGAEAIQALAPKPGEQLIDIGCGCGQTTLDLAGRVGPQGSVVGVDISRPMLEVARRRAGAIPSLTADFREADVQSADLGGAVFDAAFSRFGVMFFSDPLAAFANLRPSLKPGGRLGFVCWRSFAENPWMAAPLAAALPFISPPTPMDPLAPGPFAFADANRVHAILTEAGFTAIDIRPHDTRIGSGDVEQTLQLAFRIGPLGAVLRDDPSRAGIIADAVRRVLETHMTPDGVLMPAAVWIVTARRA
jgi:ubiquinone/menaquinone biosynthesis C-methylase UbiE